MVIQITPSGSVSCEISDFRIVVDLSPSERVAQNEPRPGRRNLILKTQTELPLTPGSLDTIDRAGEYEIAGIKINGFTIPGEPNPKIIKAAYLVSADGINLCFLDGIVKELDDAFIEKLGEVDILFISADKKSAEPQKLAALVKEIEPRIILTINEAAAKGLEEGLGKKPEVMGRLVVKRNDFEGEEGTKFIWLKAI
jgi:hypothetical protein